MKTLRFTLVAEGTSDRVLVPILRWMLLHLHPRFQWMGQIADLYELSRPPNSLPERISVASGLFPADVFFIHRDADRDPPSNRRREVSDAVDSLEAFPARHWIPVIPVRMTEAWLLVSESALRGASGNPNGRTALHVPALKSLESLPDPKAVLQKLLVDAGGLSGRRRKKANFSAQRARIPDFFEDWEALLRLPSAKRVYDEIAALDFD